MARTRYGHPLRGPSGLHNAALPSVPASQSQALFVAATGCAALRAKATHVMQKWEASSCWRTSSCSWSVRCRAVPGLHTTGSAASRLRPACCWMPSNWWWWWRCARSTWPPRSRWCRWLHRGYTVRNPVQVSTQWLHGHQRERACYYFHGDRPLISLVPER